MAADETRIRLLDVAERLFVAHGYDGVSVRAVNAAAGMNPAAVHYHFGSKRGLVAALLQQRLAPVWAEPLAELGRRRAEGWTPTPAELADVIVTPLAAVAADPDGRVLLHLLARLVLSDGPEVFDDPWFRVDPWRELLGACRPDLTPSQIRHRWQLGFAMVLQVYGQPLADPGRLATNPLPPADAVASFLTSGLDAPATSVAPPGRRAPTPPDSPGRPTASTRSAHHPHAAAAPHEGHQE